MILKYSYSLCWFCLFLFWLTTIDSFDHTYESENNSPKPNEKDGIGQTFSSTACNTAGKYAQQEDQSKCYQYGKNDHACFISLTGIFIFITKIFYKLFDEIFLFFFQFF